MNNQDGTSHVAVYDEVLCVSNTIELTVGSLFATTCSVAKKYFVCDSTRRGVSNTHIQFSKTRYGSVATELPYDTLSCGVNGVLPMRIEPLMRRQRKSSTFHTPLLELPDTNKLKNKVHNKTILLRTEQEFASEQEHTCYLLSSLSVNLEHFETFGTFRKSIRSSVALE